MKTSKYLDKSVKLLGITSFVLYIVINALTLINPFIIQDIIDVYIPSKDVNGTLLSIALFVAIPCIYIILQYVYNYIVTVVCRNKSSEISTRIFKNIIRKDMIYFNTQNTVELMEYSSKEAVSYVMYFVQDLPQIYANIFFAVVVLIVIFIKSFTLGLLQFLFIPLAFFPFKWLCKKVMKLGEDIMKRNAKVRQFKVEAFRNILYIKNNCIEESIIECVDNENKELNKLWGKTATLDPIAGIWIKGFVAMLFTGLTFGIGAFVAIKDIGLLSTGELVGIVNLSGMFYGFFAELVMIQVQFHKSKAEFDMLFSYIDLENDENDAMKEFTFANDLQVNNVSFSYVKGQEILKDVCLSVRKGEWIAIVGESGSGKSTLMHLLTGIYPIEKGSIRYDGVSLSEINSNSLHQQVTYISQNSMFFTGSIADNMRMICKDASDEQIYEVLRQVNLDRYIERLDKGIYTDIGEAGKLMSGGEQRRLTVALGLIRNNMVLITDEITSNLDFETESDICRLLYSLREKGYTIISITHSMNFAEYADRVYELKGGKLIL